MTTKSRGITPSNQTSDIVHSLAASPNFATDGICFAGRQSGLYISEDGGQSWRYAYGSLDLVDHLPTPAVAVSPDFGSDRLVLAGAAGGVLYSVDAGESWQVVLFRDPPPVVIDLAVSPDFLHDGTLFAGTMEDGVFNSSDRGGHWASWNFGLLDLNVICLAISRSFAEDETIFVGAESGIFRSTNGGRAWREVDFPIELAPVLSLGISSNYEHDGIIYAGTETNGLYRSADRGATWGQAAVEVGEEPVNAILISNDFADTPDILLVTSSGAQISRDGGDSWESLDLTTIPADDSISACLAPEGLALGAPLLLGLAEGGIVRIRLDK